MSDPLDGVHCSARPTRYTVVIEALPDEDGDGFLVTVPDLPGCMSDGPTREAAARSVEDAITSWIEEAQSLGCPIPHPTRKISMRDIVPTDGVSFA